VRRARSASPARLVLAGLAAGFALTAHARAAWAANPDAGQAGAIEDGRQLYGQRCFVCHLANGGRGPDLHASTLSDEGFVSTVLNGRKGTQMPAFKGLITPEEVLKIRAFLRAGAG